MDKSPLLVITGPTATGKTALSAALAEAVGGEIISADSMQIYRRMDIGTAKVTPAEMRGVPHHMVDIAEPDEDWSAARWTEAAAACADDILARGRIPIVAGGTGLYIDSLLAGRDFGAAPGDSGLRETLSARYEEEGAQSMWEELHRVDPERAEKLAPADKKRVLRALEVFLLTGETITEHDRRSQALPPRYRSIRFALTWNDRSRLYDRIDTRVDSMVAAGLVDEVEALLKSGIPDTCTAMQAIGYKEIAAALRGAVSMAEAIENVKRESRRYAKRQLTWLRRDRELHWLPREETPSTEDALAAVLEILRQNGSAG